MNKRILLSLSFVFAFLLFVPVVSAQTTASREAKPATSPKDLLIQKVASKTADRMEKVDAKIASREASMAGKVASRSAALKARLQTFKDKKKAATIERIDEMLLKINERRTSQMLKHLDTMSMILGKAETRATAAQEAGKDVSMAMTEITSTKTQIAKAKTAVEDQMKKTYEITIASESGAKASVQSTRDLLETDLKTTHGLVKEARRSLINSLTKLAQSLGEGGSTDAAN